MSRCFPFPPPGYDKKVTPDDVNLIIKEKHKQKKHKDKDKDKKERSKKKEKEKSEGKDKKDKDRKEKKHRDKKEEKRKSLEEQKNEGPTENQNGENLGSGSKPNDQIQDRRVMVELGKRVRDDCGATSSQMVQKNFFQEPKNGLVVNPSRENQNNVEGGSHQVHGDIQKNTLVGQKNGLVGNFPREKQNKVEGGPRRVRADNQIVQKNALVGQKNDLVGNVSRENSNKVEGGPRQVRADNQIVQKNVLVGQKNGLVGNFSRENPTKVEGGSRRVHADNQIVQKNVLMGQKNGLIGNFSGENRNKAEGGPPQVDDLEKGKEGEKGKKIHKSSDGKGDGHKKKDRDKSSKAEEKKKRKNEKREKKEKKKQEIKQRESSGNVPDFCNNKLSFSDLQTDKHENLPKSRELPLNGFLHDNGIQPNNIPRPVSSFQTGQNGSVLDPSQETINSAMEKGRFTNTERGPSSNNGKADHEGPVISNDTVNNGPTSSNLISIEKKKIEPHQTGSNVAKPPNNLKVSSSNSKPVVENGRKTAQPDNRNGVVEDKPCTSSRASFVKAKDKKVDAYKKPPHPDSKYLNEIYSVPPQIEWPQFDDQEWLFGDSRAKRAKLGPSEIEPAKQVWAEAMQVESADVIALPYVVPY